LFRPFFFGGKGHKYVGSFTPAQGHARTAQGDQQRPVIAAPQYSDNGSGCETHGSQAEKDRTPAFQSPDDCLLAGELIP